MPMKVLHRKTVQRTRAKAWRIYRRRRIGRGQRSVERISKKERLAREVLTTTIARQGELLLLLESIFKSITPTSNKRTKGAGLT